MLNYPPDTNNSRAVVGRGEERPLYDPGPELLLGGSVRVVRGK